VRHALNRHRPTLPLPLPPPPETAAHRATKPSMAVHQCAAPPPRPRPLSSPLHL
jgi:hypothetical protein